jgi:hypothetical protein
MATWFTGEEGADRPVADPRGFCVDAPVMYNQQDFDGKSLIILRY